MEEHVSGLIRGVGQRGHTEACKVGFLLFGFMGFMLMSCGISVVEVNCVCLCREGQVYISQLSL